MYLDRPTSAQNAGSDAEQQAVSTPKAAQNAIVGRSRYIASAWFNVLADGTILSKSFKLTQPKNRPAADPASPRQQPFEITC